MAFDGAGQSGAAHFMEGVENRRSRAGDTVNRYRVQNACLLLLLAILLCGFNLLRAQPPSSTSADGYRGIWFTLGQVSEYGDKYSGGLGTYTANHVPIAIHAPAVNKTFFVYGGTKKGKRHLLIMASYYDHARGVVPQPTVVHDKEGVNDPHDNPSLAIDDQGYLWVFISGRGRARPGFIYRSTRPHDCSHFEQVRKDELTYPQPWFLEGRGFLHLFTKYTRGRELYFETSPDGTHWMPAQKLAGIGGHYQVSTAHQGKVGSFFNRHPDGNVDRRTDLYYLETADGGKSWITVDGKPLTLPLSDADNPARVVDYSQQKRLMYTMDLQFDAKARPVLLYLTSAHHEPGPAGDPREWTVCAWTGSMWQTRVICRSDHNYDFGSLAIHDARWTVIGSTEPGPQPWGTGGEIAIYESLDEGQNWSKCSELTRNSRYNHGYVRQVVHGVDPFCYLWADGDPKAFSESRLYFADSKGEHYWQLPYDMDDAFAKPTLVR